MFPNNTQFFDDISYLAIFNIDIVQAQLNCLQARRYATVRQLQAGDGLFFYSWHSKSCNRTVAWDVVYPFFKRSHQKYYGLGFFWACFMSISGYFLFCRDLDRGFQVSTSVVWYAEFPECTQSKTLRILWLRVVIH